MVRIIRGAAPSITEKVIQSAACKLTVDVLKKIAARAEKHGLLVQWQHGYPYIDGHRADRWQELSSKAGSRGRDQRFQGCFIATSN
jgi:hypothetical protein